MPILKELVSGERQVSKPGSPAPEVVPLTHFSAAGRHHYTDDIQTLKLSEYMLNGNRKR